MFFAPDAAFGCARVSHSLSSRGFAPIGRAGHLDQASATRSPVIACAGAGAPLLRRAPIGASEFAEERARRDARDRTEVCDEMRLIVIAGGSSNPRPARVTVFARRVQR